ncbi:MAG: DUF2905 domain-containing protein [Endomicrobiales bacterium]
MMSLGKWLVLIGAILIVVGVIVMLAGKIPFLGRLPGDISIKKGNFSFFFPLTSSILISIVVSILLWLFKK